METVARTNQINPEWLKAPTNLFTLGPGDKLEIELLDDPTSKTTATVGPDGKIYFQLLSGLDVWGLTEFLTMPPGRRGEQVINALRGGREGVRLPFLRA